MSVKHLICKIDQLVSMKAKWMQFEPESAGSVIDVDIHIGVQILNIVEEVNHIIIFIFFMINKLKYLMEEKSEVVGDYSVNKIVVKLEELSVDSVSNDNMVNNKEVCKKERIIRTALNTISSCQSKLINNESSDDEDLSLRVSNSDDLKDQMKFAFHIEAHRESVTSLGTSSICAQLSNDISSKNKMIDELSWLA
ncbi:hypothetical protein Tco_0488472 [Tanacetum coccineum]